MERKFDSVLENWYSRKGHKALIVRGPRQVGKSYSIRKFGFKKYSTVIELNFEDSPDYMSIFEGDLSAKAVFEKLSLAFPTESFEGSLLFLDEIQRCPGAFSALKPLVQDGRCDIICSGSVLSEAIGEMRLLPIGFVEQIYLSPMDFEEFLWAMGFSHSQTENIRTHIQNMEPFERFVLTQLNELFKRYIVIGGMPESVSAYVNTGLYSNSFTVLKALLSLLSDDINQYVRDSTDKIRIRQCIDSIPRQLSREKYASFLYSEISPNIGYGKREFGPAVRWVEEAGMIDICHNIEEISEPFRIKTNGNAFKVYVKDTGVLVCMLGANVAKGIVDGDTVVNNGAVMENAIAESLIRKGYDVYYYSNNSRRLEIDFVLNMNGLLSVMEVKSGRKKSAKSLIKVLNEDKVVKIAIKVSDSNLSVDENGVRHYPLFGPSFFEEAHVSEPSQMHCLENLKAALE